MKTPTEMLEEELAFFAAELEPDLDRLRDLAPLQRDLGNGRLEVLRDFPV